MEVFQRIEITLNLWLTPLSVILHVRPVSLVEGFRLWLLLSPGQILVVPQIQVVVALRDDQGYSPGVLSLIFERIEV